MSVDVPGRLYFLMPPRSSLVSLACWLGSTLRVQVSVVIRLQASRCTRAVVRHLDRRRRCFASSLGRRLRSCAAVLAFNAAPSGFKRCGARVVGTARPILVRRARPEHAARGLASRAGVSAVWFCECACCTRMARGGCQSPSGLSVQNGAFYTRFPDFLQLL